MIGYAKLKSRGEFTDWLRESGWSRKRESMSPVYSGGWYHDNWTSYFYQRQNIFENSKIINIFKDCVKEEFQQDRTAGFFRLLEYLDSINQNLEVYYRDDFACIVGFGTRKYVMPLEWYEFTQLQDYSHLTQTELTLVGGPVAGGCLPAASAEESRDDLERLLLEQKNQLNDLNRQKQEIEEASCDSLRAMKEEIERLRLRMQEMQQALLSELELKQLELNKKKLELEQKLFILETQIYGIRCYLGEVVKFHKICEGVREGNEEPVIIYQKIRYLDEELGKAASIYDFEGDSRCKESFLKILKYREDIRELFVPSSRCITVLRVSRTGTMKAASDKIANILCDFELYHGTQLAILIRNGQELYITWLDEDKIKLWDENVFYSPTGTKTEIPYDEDGHPIRQSATKEEVASRYFLLSILQGIADEGSILNFPEKVNILAAHQPYIQFSMADGWLTDTRFGTLADILERVTAIPMKEGDMVLTCLTITRDDIYEKTSDGRSRQYEAYNNDRGIGESNRTHDARIPSLKILPVNRVLYDITVECRYQKIKADIEGAGDSHRKTFSLLPTQEVLGEETSTVTLHFQTILDWKQRGLVSNKLSEAELLHALEISYGMKQNYYYMDERGREHSCGTYFFEKDETEQKVFYRKKYVSAVVTERVPHYFLSALKTSCYWESENASARANMEFLENEVIPLNYLCVTWIRYIITTGQIGGWRIGRSSISYAQSLKYLNRILEFLKKIQEAEEKMLAEAGLGQWIEKTAEWDVAVLEWRIKHQIRRLTPFQARRFAKEPSELTDKRK